MDCCACMEILSRSFHIGSITTSDSSKNNRSVAHYFFGKNRDPFRTQSSNCQLKAFNFKFHKIDYIRVT